jgi:hypothetical protein
MSTNSSVYLYAIHDPWFHGMPDGDVDDRSAFCVYEKFAISNPDKKIIVHVGDRYEETVEHYGHFHLEFRKEFLEEEVASADKICICAPVKNEQQRNTLTHILSLKNNGYCQGCKIGCMNFPNQNYMPLLESIAHRYSTVDTMITFPVSFTQRLDPLYWEEYQKYGLLKLFSPGAIVHIPGLLYRLYCPGLGGGPGTNMLTIQKCLQTHFDILDEMTVDKDHFMEFNQALIKKKSLKPTSAIQKMPHVMAIPELVDSLTVMVYFANLVYRIQDGPLYKDDTELYSLQSIPEGTIWIQETETPPLYDLVAAHAMLYDVPVLTKEELIALY